MGFTRAAVGGKITAAMYNEMADGSRWYLPANEVARGSISTATEGDFCYQLDTDVVYFFDGSTWRIVGGKAPAFAAAVGTAQSIASGATPQVASASFAAPTINRGFTSWSSGALTIAASGLYQLHAMAEFATLGAAARLGVQLTRNSVVANTDAVVKNTILSRNSVSAGGLVLLFANDAIRMFVFQDSGAAVNLNPDIASGFAAHYVGMP